MNFLFSKLYSLNVVFLFSLLKNVLLASPSSLDFSNLKISTGENSIYQNSRLNSYFNYNYQKKYSCVVPQVLEDDLNVGSRNIKIENLFNCRTCAKTLTLQTLIIDWDKSILVLAHNYSKPEPLFFGDELNINIKYDCYRDNTETWSLITYTLIFEEVPTNITFSHIKICSTDNSKARFDFSYLILAIIAIIVLGFASRLHSLKYFKKDREKYEVSFLLIVFYGCICSGSFLLVYFFYNVAIWIFMVIFGLLSLFSLIIILNEIGEFLPLSMRCICFSSTKYNKISLVSITLTFIAVAIVACWAYYNYFVLVDICAFGIVIFALKVLKITSFQNAVILTTCVMIFELVWGFLLNYALGNYYDTFFSSEYCVPARIVIPTFNNFIHQACSWLPISSLIFPGLTLVNLQKYDKSKKTKTYFRTGMIAFTFGAVIWILICAYVDETVPMSFFSFPLMAAFIMILSYLRNEHTELWFGAFYKGNSIEPQSSMDERMSQFRSLNSNYNKEEIFGGLLSKKGSRREDEIVDGSSPKRIDAKRINSSVEDSSNLQDKTEVVSNA